MAITPVKQHLLKLFGNDPLYRNAILAKTSTDLFKALKILSSIRGPNAVRLLTNAYDDYSNTQNNTNRGG